MTDTTSISSLDRIRSRSDHEAWERFVAVYGPLVSSWLKRHGLRPQDTEDVQQEIMDVLLRELPNFQHNGRPGAFRRWLRMVTANRLRTFWRSAQRRPEAPGGSAIIDLARQMEDPDSGLSRQWNKEHDRHVIKGLLEQIAPSFQEKSLQAFRCIVLHGEDAEKVASELNMTVNAVRVAQSRVLAALREVGQELLD